MSRFAWSAVYWYGAWLGVGFLAAELLGYVGVAPWGTLSETVWRSENISPVVAVLIFSTLLFLGAHFLYHRPIWASIAFGLIVAVTAHLIDKSWP